MRWENEVMPWYEWERYPKSTPRDVKGGIRASSKRGRFGESWWARRWISVLEGFNLGARLGRGKSYARRGQVVSIEIEPGKVEATVQGSRPKPYRVSIAIAPLTRPAWKRLAVEFSSSPIHLAKLLAGEMPEDVEMLFERAKIPLFPTRMREIRTECSCPDWSNPCKHIAAVYYLLGEEFDRDPFLIFRLRGLDREDLSSMIAAPKPRAKPRVEKEALEDEESGAARLRAGDEASPEFWNASRPAIDLFGTVEASSEAAPLLRRLGPFPFWRGERPLIELLEPSYRNAAARAELLVLEADHRE